MMSPTGCTNQNEIEVVRPETGGAKFEKWVGAIAVMLATTYFFSLWWNRSLSPTSGGDLFIAVSADYMLTPFRDFYVSCPPGSIWLIRALGALGGNRLIVFWAFGAFVQVVGAVGLYFWLCRIVRPAFSSFAVVATFVFASGDIADYPFFYNHMAVNCCLLAGWATAVACDGRAQRRRLLLSVVSGLFLGCAFAVKQTNGLICLAIILGTTFLVLWNRRDKKGAAVVLGGITIGALVPLLSTFLWLVSSGTLGAFVEQVFTKGPSSKGGLALSLVRPFYLTWSSHALLTATAKALVVLGLGVVGYLSGRKKKTAPVARWYWSATVLAVVAMLIGSSLSRIPPGGSREPSLILCYVSLVGCLLMSAIVVVRLLVLRRPVDANHALLATVGFGSAYALSMSWPAFEIMILPGVTYLLAVSLQEVSGRLLANSFRFAAIFGCLLIITTVTWRKQMIPQSWGRWSEPPIPESTIRPDLPELSGFVLSPATATFYQFVTETIVAHSRPTDRIFVYPNMPIFYALAKRLPTTQGLNHWVDTCPDYLARADAKRLLADPPSVIVIHPDLPQELAMEEAIFRDGKRSAVREILAAIQTLLPKYDLVATYTVPGHPVPVWIYSLN